MPYSDRVPNWQGGSNPVQLVKRDPLSFDYKPFNQDQHSVSNLRRNHTSTWRDPKTWSTVRHALEHSLTCLMVYRQLPESSWYTDDWWECLCEGNREGFLQTVQLDRQTLDTVDESLLRLWASLWSCLYRRAVHLCDLAKRWNVRGSQGTKNTGCLNKWKLLRASHLRCAE